MLKVNSQEINNFKEQLHFFLIDVNTLKQVETLIREGWDLVGVDYDEDREYSFGITLNGEYK